MRLALPSWIAGLWRRPHRLPVLHVWMLLALRVLVRMTAVRLLRWLLCPPLRMSRALTGRGSIALFDWPHLIERWRQWRWCRWLSGGSTVGHARLGCLQPDAERP